MKTYNFGPGTYVINQLADELVAAGVPMGGEARIERNAFPFATNITIFAQDSAVDAVVNATVAAHVPIGIVDAAAIQAAATAAALAAAMAQVDARIATVVGAAPAALDTLVEIVTQLANDESAVAALTTVVAGKATAAQGVKADTALQPAGNGGSLTGITKGQVGLGSVDNTADTSKPVSTATAAAIPNSSYRMILQAAGSHIATRPAGTYALGYGNPLAISGTGTLYPLAIIDIAAADFPTVNGLAAKLRIRATLETNDAVPFVGTFTVGLFPITRPTTSGGVGLCIYTLGAVVPGSNGAVFTNPPVDANLAAVGADFALPANGRYVLGVVTSAAMAAASLAHINAQLQMRNA